MAPLHRQYKTARTETRWHLLLKIRQMPIQTSASRGYVLFSGANKGHSQKSLNGLRLADTPPECSKLGKTQIITAGKSGGVRNSVFCDPNVSLLLSSGTPVIFSDLCNRQRSRRSVCEPHFALFFKSLRFGKLTNAQVMIKLTLACKKCVKKV